MFRVIKSFAVIGCHLTVGSERGSAFERPTNSARGKGKTIVNNIDIIENTLDLLLLQMFFPVNVKNNRSHGYGRLSFYAELVRGIRNRTIRSLYLYSYTTESKHVKDKRRSHKPVFGRPV